MKIKNISSEIKHGIIRSKKEDCYKECHLIKHNDSSFACSYCYLGVVQQTLRKLNFDKWARVNCSALYAMIFDEYSAQHHDCVDKNNAIMKIFGLIGKRSCKI